MNSATSAATVGYLRQLIAQFGILETIVSDNGTQLVAAKFKEFCQLNGIQHVQTALYHLSSNGLAEQAMQVFKQGIRKQLTGTIHDKIARVLFPISDDASQYHWGHTSRVAARKKFTFSPRSPETKYLTQSN